jgi:hypothetical protein
MLICLIAEGFKLPSFNTGTSFLPLTDEELEKLAPSPSAAGEESLRVGREGANNGMERPKATASGRAGLRNRKEAGRGRTRVVAEDRGLLRRNGMPLVRVDVRREGRRGEVARRRSIFVWVPERFRVA